MSWENEKVMPDFTVDVNDTINHSICLESGENNKCVTLADQDLFSVGRFLTLRLTVKNVAPNKQIAIGIKIYETTGGTRVIKGNKMYAVAHNGECCQNITLKNIHFVLPEEIAETDDKSNICSRRTFDIETTSHYIDIDRCHGKV